MKTLSIILNSIQDKRILSLISQHSHMIYNTQKIVILFTAKERWFSFNDPRSILASLQTMNQSEGIKRKNIIQYLGEIEKSLKEINKNVEIVKIVVFGEEKYKVTKCLKLLRVEICLMRNKRMNILEKIFTKPLHEYINEDLTIPVVLL